MSNLPVWFRGNDALKLEASAAEYWQHIESALFSWLEQLDEESAAVEILDLLAWERDVNRIPGEPKEIYAKRIKHAVANATDAGSNIGMGRIFERLGFGHVDINERLPNYDWDMIEIAMEESEQTGKQDLIKEIIRAYGRTCRRYFLSTYTAVESTTAAALIEFDKEVVQ